MRMTELAPGGELTDALRKAGLPVEDLGHPGQFFWRFAASDGGALGYAGLEGDGPDVLLRSVMIDPAARGHGHGLALVEAIAGEAAKRGVERLWLLTLDAAGFFEKAGFARVPRDTAPPAIAATAEFVSLCPVTAVCMARTLINGETRSV
ncbi:MAG: arsenic resistance N-acetyltransferase ArsN2 [Alphaproteobacteria bacterium]